MQRRRWHSVAVRGVLALSFAGLAGGCASDKKADSGPGPIDNTNRLDWGKAAALSVASSCDDALTAFRTAARTQMELELEQTKRCYLADGGCYRMMEDAPAASGNGTPKDDATPDEYSKTNTQVDGVDEADTVKTDGTHIYALYGNELVILNSWPAVATNVVGRIKLPGSWTYGIYLSGKTVVALTAGTRHDLMGLTDQPAKDGEAYDPSYWRDLTIATTIDVTNPAAPLIKSKQALDGWVVQSRRIDDKVYLALNEWIWIPGVETWPSDLPEKPTPEQVEAKFAAMHEANVAAIDKLDLDFWLPRKYAFDANGLLAATGTELTRCGDVYIPSVHSGQSLLTVATLDIDDASLSASTVQGEWGNVYASTDAFYVATTDWNFYWYWEPTPDEAPPLTTHIHKFAFGDDGVARYAASGAVQGYAINNYAFDEYGGNLRVATTDGFGWWRPGDTTESRVTVLGESGGQLVKKGEVGGLGKGQQIYAVRFAGTKGYVVTFRQVDPLYVIDLGNAAAPAVSGELEIEGYSSYIHPLDAGHLLTVGRDADADGHVKGLKLEIFDVTNPTAPASVTRTLIGDDWGTWSDAQYDPHAFQYFAARGLLAIPVAGWAPVAAGSDTWEYHSDLFVFKVTNDAITKLGTVSHMGLLEQLGVNTGCRSWWGWNVAYIARGIFIEDYVYSISNVGVAVHDTRDLAAGAVAEVVVVDDDSWNGGAVYYDPCMVDAVPADGGK